MLFLNVLSMGCLGWIAYQDFRERQVYILLFLVLGFCWTILFYMQSAILEVYGYSILLNLVLVALFLTLSYAATRFIFKKKFLGHSIGMGDILFFLCAAVGFPSITFLVLFTCALLFSLFLFLGLKRRFRMETVPLAGCMALFFGIVIGLSGVMENVNLYSY